MNEISGKMKKRPTRNQTGGSQASKEGGSIRSRQKAAPKKKPVQAASQTARVSTSAEFVKELQMVRLALDGLRRQPDRTPAQSRDIETIETRLRELGEEARQPEPDAGKIGNLLDNTRLLARRLGESFEPAHSLAPTLDRLAKDARRLFAD